MLFIIKDKFLHLSGPMSKKEAQCFMKHFEFWRQHLLHLGLELELTYWVTLKVVVLSGTQMLCSKSRL